MVIGAGRRGPQVESPNSRSGLPINGQPINGQPINGQPIKQRKRYVQCMEARNQRSRNLEREPVHSPFLASTATE